MHFPVASYSPAPLAEIARSICGNVINVPNAFQGAENTFTRIPLIEQINEVMPAVDLLFGGTMMIAIILLHASAIHHITNYVARRTVAIMRHPTRWQASLLMGSVVFALMLLQVTEIVAWSAALVHSGLLPNWKDAGFFAANAFTTVGFGSDILPHDWRMLGPIIAMSGLFTFGWSGSVLVDLVGRSQRIREAALAGTTEG